MRVSVEEHDGMGRGMGKRGGWTMGMGRSKYNGRACSCCSTMIGVIYIIC